MSDVPTLRRGDRGFTLVEFTVVVVMLAVVVAVTIFSVRGLSDSVDETSCASEASTLARAAGVYLDQHSVDGLPATGAGPDRFEVTLVEAGLLNDTSTYYDLAADGTVTTSGEPCP